MTVAEGDVLTGKYLVERVIGRGGMGLVMSARHVQLNQRVAIKLLLQTATPEVVERFLREARAAVRLKSDHVARVIDVGELPTGAPYMVMEFLEGSDLSNVVRAHGACAIPDAVEYVLHACEAIAEAHSLGIIHRDLKPANLFLTRAADGSNTVKVLDFGISKASGAPGEEEGMALTKTSTMLGSPLYMSPEQMKSAKDADARSDIWSLGAILYELLTASVPFDTTVFAELVMMVNTEEPPPIAQKRPDVPPELAAATLKCLEKKRENRFQNVADFAWAIAPFGPPHAQASAERASRMLEAAGLVTSGARSVRLSSEHGVAASMTALSSSAAAAREPAKSGGRRVIVGAGAAVAVGGLAAFLFIRGNHATVATDATHVAPIEAASSAPATSAATPIVAPVVSANVELPDASAAPAAPPSVSPAPPGPAVATPRPNSGKPQVAPPPPAVPQAPPPPPAIPQAPPPPGKRNPLDIQIK